MNAVNPLLDMPRSGFFERMLEEVQYYLYKISPYNWLRYRIWDRYHVVKMKYLEPGYHDATEILIHSMFQVLCDFIEKEKPDEIVAWDSDEEHKHARKEMQELYDWWKERQNRDKLDPIHQPDIKSPSMKFTPVEGKKDLSSMEFVHESPEDKAKWEKACDESSAWEIKCEKEDEEMMIRLSKIRGFLWT
jgi:hypothetical protein